jgi:16S rRNA (uracil1498-N3)-methyltransferase
MKLQRFYIKEMHNKYGEVFLGQELWVHEPELVNQILKVFRAKIGYELVLFNDKVERLYQIVKIDGFDSIKLKLVANLERKLPSKQVILLFSVLKNDKNEWVLQKATELGVHEFVPVIAERSEKIGFNIERGIKIIKEASEQCGRSDIPLIREPISIHEALQEYSDYPLIICEQNHQAEQANVANLDNLALLIGPEGGWSDIEKTDFSNRGLIHLNLSKFTLRAETACVMATGLALNS